VSLNTDMLSIDDINSLDLEISSYCIASCPMCPRNFFGMEHNAGYPVTNITIEDFQNVFPSSFVSQIQYVTFNGNLGDFNMNPDSEKILNYLRTHSPDIELDVHTNGSSRNSDFWSSLAASDPIINFDIDGLEDTHHLYRIGTSFEKILSNAKSFIQAGGRAVWKMIEFDHNKHQIHECRQRAKDLGFIDFRIANDGRDDAYVFNKQGEYSHTIGKPSYPQTDHANTLMEWKKEHYHSNKEYLQQPKKNIDCHAKKNNRIFMSSNGDVYPCCWLGISPKTYDEELHAGNSQLKSLMKNVKNNAITYGLASAIEWFNLIEDSWKKETFQSGKLYRCDMYCGKD
jgi:MoaA/NifB/PqqE/SkfB family radical SAM enzyme